jgi:hypothetical protein
MKLNYDKKSKDPTYFIQQGIRNGKKVTTKNVKRIGKHSELLAITDDPLAYAKEQVAKYNQEYKEGKTEIQFKIDFDEKLIASGDITSRSQMKNIGYFVLQKIYQSLNLKDFFDSVLAERKITFPCNDINRFLTYGRILDPRSKWGTYDRIDTYYGMENSFDYHHIIRHLDVLCDNFDKYMEHLFVNSNNVVKRNTSVCYFDCTNYFFECEHEDDVCIDPVTGEVLRGLRKYGPSKEHRPTPIVQMGLFMDGNGIPISMCINPGSQNEQLCAVPLERKIINMFGTDKLIYCADGGLGSYPIRQYNSMGERAYIVTQSIKKLSNVMKEAVFSDCDYHRKSDNTSFTVKAMKEFDRFDSQNKELYSDTVYKVIVADRAVDTGLTEVVELKNGKKAERKITGQLKQYIIVTFSRKMMEYQRHIRNGQIERAKELLKTKDPEMIKKGPNDVTRFIKRKSTGKNGEEATDNYYVDQSVIEEEEKYDGYYAVATNLNCRKHEDAVRILDISAGRNKIEDCFRVLKTNFSARPAYVSERNHIIGHFITCYTALLVYRLLETKLDQTGTHFTTDQILETLKVMNVMNFQDTFYASAYTESEVGIALNAAFDLGLNKKYYQPKDLNKKLKNILK